MSHIVEIKTGVRDESAVQSACSRLHLPRATQGPDAEGAGALTDDGFIVRKGSLCRNEVVESGRTQLNQLGRQWPPAALLKIKTTLN